LGMNESKEGRKNAAEAEVQGMSVDGWMDGEVWWSLSLYRCEERRKSDNLCKRSGGPQCTPQGNKAPLYI